MRNIREKCQDQVLTWSPLERRFKRDFYIEFAVNCWPEYWLLSA